jgi:hypothetical protein
LLLRFQTAAIHNTSALYQDSMNPERTPIPGDARDKEALGIQYYGCLIVHLYHEDRTHMGLNEYTPGGRSPSSGHSGIVVWPRLGGLHHPLRARCLKDSCGKELGGGPVRWHRPDLVVSRFSLRSWISDFASMHSVLVFTRISSALNFGGAQHAAPPCRSTTLLVAEALAPMGCGSVHLDVH